MQLLFLRMKNLLSGLLALALAASVGLGIYMMNACKLRALNGERVFYLHSASSQGLRKTELTLRDYANITGESVRFSRGEQNAEALAQYIAKQYGAEILFTEEACGITSYYCHTARWKESIAVNGARVNLHIAVSEEECAVGTPIIFDGF